MFILTDTTKVATYIIGMIFTYLVFIVRTKGRPSLYGDLEFGKKDSNFYMNLSPEFTILLSWVGLLILAIHEHKLKKQ